MRKGIFAVLLAVLMISTVSAHSFTIPDWGQGNPDLVAPADKYLDDSADVEKSYKGMLVLGAEHILDSEAQFFNVSTPFLNDHGYLLIGVMLIPGYLISRDVGKYWQLVEMATSFAVGHWLAVMSVYFGLFSIPGFIVESGIALSIALIGLERLAVLEGKWEDSRKRILPILLFTGFWHGNGFAAVVNSVSFDSLFTAVTMISTFSLGVDIGQMLLMAVAGAGMYLGMKYLGEDSVVRFGSVSLVLIGMSLALFRFIPVVGGLL